MTTIHQPEMRREDGAIFLTVAENDRLAIATSIERLIDLLDAMQPDPDLEDDADDEPSLGSLSLGSYQAGTTDDREGDDSDYEDGGDDEDSDPGEDSDPLEPSLCGTAIYNPTTGALENDLEGEGDGFSMRADDEYELGWTEHIDQRLAGKVQEGTWNHPEGEPDLGWTGIATGWREGDPVDAIEPNGDELDFNGDEGDYDGGENDPPGFIWGGGEGGGRAHENA
ncbi:hypothetical protein [Mesorhizobium sp. M0847]|uniref:hypothetical protein n=1 Tax=unclassified Mesorhizobium TaxID=325217 RepID=UPI00333D4822